MLCSFLIESEQATWFLAAWGFLEALTQQHQQPKTLPSTRSQKSENFSFLGFQHCEGDTLHWPDIWKMETVNRVVLSQLSLAHTCMCALSLVLVIDINWIAAGMSYQLQQSTGKTLKCHVIPGADRIPGSLNTVASATKESSSHKVWGVWYTILWWRHSSLIWPFDKDGNWEENGSLTFVTGWHLHVALSSVVVIDMKWIVAGMSYQLHSNTGKTLN